MNIFFVYSNLEALTATIFVSLSDALVTLKIYYFVKNIRILKQLMRKLDDEVFQPRNVKQRALVQPSLNIWTATYIGFWVPAALTLTLWSVFPILDKSVQQHRLPFAAWYPYDTKKSPFYELTYLHQVVSIWFLSTANLHMDTMLTALMMYIGVQCDILCDNLKNLENELGYRMGFKEKLIDCIKHHKEILSFAKNCNEFINMIALGQFFTSAVSNGLSMFQLTLVAPFSSECYSLLFFVGSITTQIFIYCWFGNEVEVK
ncbi:7tm 6 domain containing protein, partial [Asbolus verrucosus]